MSISKIKKAIVDITIVCSTLALVYLIFYAIYFLLFKDTSMLLTKDLISYILYVLIALVTFLSSLSFMLKHLHEYQTKSHRTKKGQTNGNS